MVCLPSVSPPMRSPQGSQGGLLKVDGKTLWITQLFPPRHTHSLLLGNKVQAPYRGATSAPGQLLSPAAENRRHALLQAPYAGLALLGDLKTTVPPVACTSSLSSDTAASSKSS